MVELIVLLGEVDGVMDDLSIDIDLVKTSTIWELLEQRASLTPQASMLVDASRNVRVTYSQARLIAERLAAGLQSQGIAPGSQVTWQLPTGLNAVMTALALSRLGCIQNPVIHLYGEHELRSVLVGSGSDTLLVPGVYGGRDFLAEATRVCAEVAKAPRVLVLQGELPQGRPETLPPPPVDGKQVRWVYYTSGTTAAPKGARHTDQTLMISGRNLAQAMGVTAADVGTIAFPYAHIGGAMYTCMLLVSGMSAVLLERFQAAEAASVFRRFGVTTTGGSTAHYEALLAEQRRQPEKPLIPSLRLLCGGGAPKPPELYHAVRREMACALTHNYGMTEVPLVSAGQPMDTDEQLANSDGAPVDGVHVRVVGGDGQDVIAGSEGEVRLYGDGVFKGYTDTRLNADAFDERGYFRTGDLGMLRSDGRLVLTGRLKDVIIRKGENISAREIEDLLYTHPKVSNVAVIGLPDRLRGERVCAVIEATPEMPVLSFTEMQDFFIAAGVMRQKIPEQLEVVAQLPRNQTLNKILKHELRARFSNNQDA